MKILILVLLPMFAQASQASYLQNILGQQFCSMGDLKDSGWGFSEDGHAYYFAPNIGMPDPSYFMKVEAGARPKEFVINAYETGTGKFIQKRADLHYRPMTGSITFGFDEYNPKACSFNR